jgi:DNA-binding transcriptional MocR family regulator
MVRLAEDSIREDQRRAIRAAGLAVSYGAEFRHRPRSEERELVLGYGNIRDEAIDEGVRALGRILRA